MRIAHISDIHIGGTNFVPDWGEKMIEMINRIEAEIVLVSGDHTDDGYEHEFEKAKEFLARIKVPHMIVVPGNHDSRNEGYTIFEEIFGTRFPYFENEEVAILGIDSTEPDIDDGHIGRENYPLIEQRLSARNKLRILVLHHHLIPIPGTGRERNIPVDAGDVLRLCVDLRVNFVLCGHKHLPWYWMLEDTCFITAGTATSRRLKGRSYPSFNVMEVEDSRVIVKEVNVAQGSWRIAGKMNFVTGEESKKGTEAIRGMYFPLQGKAGIQTIF